MGDVVYLLLIGAFVAVAVAFLILKAVDRL
jgi:hypothetical protein